MNALMVGYNDDPGRVRNWFLEVWVGEVLSRRPLNLSAVLDLAETMSQGEWRALQFAIKFPNTVQQCSDRDEYTVQIDDIVSKVEAVSLAEVANRIRHTGKHFRVWSPAGVLLIDTKFGDTYGLVKR